MDILACRELADQAITSAYWIAGSEGFFFGLASAGWVVWRMAAKMRVLRAELLQNIQRLSQRRIQTDTQLCEGHITTSHRPYCRGSLFFFTLFVLMTSSAQASIFEMPVPQDLIAFVEARTGIKLPEGQKVDVVDNDDPLFISEAARLAGATGAERGMVIYLPVRAAVHFQEPYIQALIVHELTHVTQDIRDNPSSCVGKRETEAYAIQNQYFRNHNLPIIAGTAESPLYQSCE